MTEQPYDRSLEAAGRRRVEKHVADIVARVRSAADEIEREARRNIESAAEEDRAYSFQNYPRVAGQVAHSLQTLLFNLPLENLIDAAADAEAGRTEERA